MGGVERTGEGGKMRNTVGKIRVSGGAMQTFQCRGRVLTPGQPSGMLVASGLRKRV